MAMSGMEKREFAALQNQVRVLQAGYQQMREELGLSSAQSAEPAAVDGDEAEDQGSVTEDGGDEPGGRQPW